MRLVCDAVADPSAPPLQLTGDADIAVLKKVHGKTS